MAIIKMICLILIGYGSGVIISGGIYAFIAIIGVVPRMAQKTKTSHFISFYEDSILMGGIFGALTLFSPFRLPVGKISLGIFGLLIGIFVGCLAVSIAEVLDVIPILSRRVKLKKGVSVLILVLALAKVIGSLVYFMMIKIQ